MHNIIAIRYFEVKSNFRNEIYTLYYTAFMMNTSMVQCIA